MPSAPSPLTPPDLCHEPRGQETSIEWFSAFSAANATVKALFDEETYAIFKTLEVRIGSGLGSEKGPTFAVWKFIEARDTALKAIYS